MRKIIFIRHGHRDKAQGYHRDNGLDEKGKKQAIEFKDYFLKNYSKKSTLLFSSPKTRCVETLIPLATALKLEIKIEEDLIEQSLNESPEHFLERVHALCNQLERLDAEIIVACSHGDWLPIGLWTFTQKADPFKKGEFREINIK